MRTRKITRGVGSDFSPAKFKDVPHIQSVEGFFICVLCPKQLNTTEAAIRSHLRKHIRQGDMRQEQMLETVARIRDRPKAGYQRRLCSKCGEGLGHSESDPCTGCDTAEGN